jgi:hypothetical protein
VDYSLGNRNAAERVLALAQERRMGVLVNVPFGGRGRGAPACSGRVSGRPLPDWAAEIDATSWAQVFLKYVVSHPAVTGRDSGDDAAQEHGGQSGRRTGPAAGRGHAPAHRAVLGFACMTSFLQRFLNVRRDEVAPLLVSAFYFCCILTRSA